LDLIWRSNDGKRLHHIVWDSTQHCRIIVLLRCRGSATGGFAKTVGREVLLVLADRCVEGHRAARVRDSLAPIGVYSDEGKEVQVKIPVELCEIAPNAPRVW
jgi:hypothetical protein